MARPRRRFEVVARVRASRKCGVEGYRGKAAESDQPFVELIATNLKSSRTLATARSHSQSATVSKFSPPTSFSKIRQLVSRCNYHFD